MEAVGEGWSETRVDMLKALWKDGLSAGQIASELGGVTRNAVIGKVHRLNLDGRSKQAGTITPKPRKPAPSGFQRRSTAALAQPAVQQAADFPPVRPESEPPAVDLDDVPLDGVLAGVEIPPGQRRTLLQLNESTCRWPIGDPRDADFFFCGGKPLDGLPYCNYHSRAAYQPAAERRRDSGRPRYR